MTTKKAVAYMRYSSNNQNETSIEYQRIAITRYCSFHNTELMKEYIDEACSGTNDRRPSFQALIRDAKNTPEWSTVIVFDLSRFCRNTRDALKYTNLLKDNHISLVSVMEGSASSDDTFFSVGVTHLKNEDQSRQNRMHTFAGMANKASKAGHCGGIPPLGYDLDPQGFLVINESEAETVRRIFEMYEQNYSYNKMAAILNAEGRTTKTGGSFTKNSFPDLLRQKKYTGMYTWNKVRQKDCYDVGNSHAYKPVEEQVRIPGGCPVIIDPERFNAVQEKLHTRAQGGAGSKRRHHYVLSGLKILKCASCGSYMIGTARVSRGQKYTTYACPNRKRKLCSTKEIRTAPLDKMVVSKLVYDLYSRQDLAQISAMLKHNSDYQKLMAKKRGNEKAIKSILNALELSCSEHLIERLNKLEADRTSLEQAIAKSAMNTDGITPQNRKAVCKKFGNYLLKSEDPDVKSYLSSVIQEILVSNEDVTIKLKIA